MRLLAGLELVYAGVFSQKVNPCEVQNLPSLIYWPLPVVAINYSLSSQLLIIVSVKVLTWLLLTFSLISPSQPHDKHDAVC